MSARALAAPGLGLILLCAACGSPPVTVGPSQPPQSSASAASPETPATGAVTVAVVGDMACPLLCAESADVAALVKARHPVALFALGDLLANTRDWSVYDTEWGALKAVTHPVPGNHEYSSSIDAYNQYWGSAAHPPEDYYSFDLGSWHVVALNGEIDNSLGSAEETWFRADLAAHPALCTAVIIHEPRWSSAEEHPSDPAKEALWDDAVGAHVDLWFAGHNHLYERFAALDSDGLPYADGTTEMVIGTGGRQLYNLAATPLPGEAVRDDHTHGAGFFSLGAGAWSMTFAPVPGETFTDSASGTCH